MLHDLGSSVLHDLGSSVLHDPGPSVLHDTVTLRAGCGEVLESRPVVHLMWMAVLERSHERRDPDRSCRLGQLSPSRRAGRLPHAGSEHAEHAARAQASEGH